MNEAGVSRSYYDQAVSALRFLYGEVLHAPHLIEVIAGPRKERKRPAVLSREDVRRLLGAVGNAKHLAILMMSVCSDGRRESEVVGHRAEDLNEGRGLMRVRGGKGRKDRVTVPSGRTFIRHVPARGGNRPGFLQALLVHGGTKTTELGKIVSPWIHGSRQAGE